MTSEAATATRAMPMTQRTRGLPWPMWAMAGLALLTLAMVGWQRLGGEAAVDPADAVSWQRALHFEDRPNGDVAVLDAQDRA